MRAGGSRMGQGLFGRSPALVLQGNLERKLQHLRGAWSPPASQLPEGLLSSRAKNLLQLQPEGGSRERQAEAWSAGLASSGARGTGRLWTPRPGAGCLREPRSQ